MNKTSDINLLKAKTLLTPQMVALDGQLRIMSLILLIGLLVTGVFIGATYLFFRRNYEVLSEKKQATKVTIAGEIRKEGLLMSIKDRLVVTKKVIDIQESWPGVLRLIDRIMGKKNSSFSINDKNEINLTIKTDSLDEALGVVGQIVLEAADKTLANPILNGVQYQKDGIFNLSLTFNPTFKNIDSPAR